MKTAVILLTLCAILIVPNYAQDNKSELDKLNKEIVTLYTKGELEEAVKVSDKVVKLGNKSKSIDKRTSAVYLATSARLKKEMFQKLRQRLLTERMDAKEYEEVRENANEYAVQSEENFKDAVEMFDDLKSDSQQAAFAKSQYAWLLYNHPGKPNRKIVTDPNKLERFEDAEKLYLEALASYDKSLGVDSNSSILTVFDLAEFYLNWSRFEKSIPFYERFIQTVEKKYGKDQATLAPALRSLSEIMILTERDSEAKKFANRISKITGKKEPEPKPNFDLRLRKKFSASKKQVLVETIDPADLMNGIETYNNTLAILRGGRRGEADTQYTFDSNSSIGIRNNRIWVEVLIDENGEVIEAKPISNEADKKKDDDLVKEAEKMVKSWKFEPFEYEGKKMKMRGFVTYTSTKVG